MGYSTLHAYESIMVDQMATTTLYLLTKEPDTQ